MGPHSWLKEAPVSDILQHWWHWWPLSCQPFSWQLDHSQCLCHPHCAANRTVVAWSGGSSEIQHMTQWKEGRQSILFPALNFTNAWRSFFLRYQQGSVPLTLPAYAMQDLRIEWSLLAILSLSSPSEGAFSPNFAPTKNEVCLAALLSLDDVHVNKLPEIYALFLK